MGNAGNIYLTTGSLSLNNGAQISAATFGLGKAGDIDILARSLSVADGAQIQSTLERATGNLPPAQGRGGNIRVTTTDSVTLSGIGSTGFSSSLETGTDRETIGNAGNITVNTNQLKILD